MSKTLLLSVSDPGSIERELEPLGARVTIRLPGNLVAVRVPESFELPRSKTVRLATDATLDAEGELFARAFLENRKIPANQPPAHGLERETKGFAPQRKGLPRDVPQASAFPPPTSLVMTGEIAVALIIASGPDDLKFTDEQVESIFAQCFMAFDDLSGANPAGKIIFTLEPHHVSITAKPPSLPDGCGTEPDPCESVFTYPALGAIGYPANASGSWAYAQELQTQADWGYIAYFTKYPTYKRHYTNGPAVVMRYTQIAAMNRVWFKNLTCRIFGASDEAAPCACGGSSGYLHAPNNNCANCPGERLPCFMEVTEDDLAVPKEDEVLCRWSRRQIGWNAWSAETNVTTKSRAKTTEAPALAEYDGKVWMVSKADDGNLWAASYDGSEWSAAVNVVIRNNDNTTTIPKSSTGVGLATYGPKLRMAYKGKTSTALYTTAFNGSTWERETKITGKISNPESSATPALTELNGKLWMAFCGKSPSPSGLYVCSSADGTNWSEQTKLDGATTSTGPALAAYRGVLWLVFRGDGESSNLFACFGNGMSWTTPIDITAINGARTLESPRLAVLGDLLWLVYKDEATVDIWSCPYDGKTWLAPGMITVQNGAKTSKSVGLAPLEITDVPPENIDDAATEKVLVAGYCAASGSGNIFSCFLQPDAKIT